MTSRSTRRNPLLIPLIVVLLVAIVAIALLAVRGCSLTSQVTSLSAAVESANAEKAALSAKLEETKAALTAQVEGITAELDAANQSLADVKARLEAASAELIADESAIAALEQEEAALEVRVADLTAKLTEAKDDHIRLLLQFGFQCFQQCFLPKIVTVQKQNILTLCKRNTCISGGADTLILLMKHMNACIALRKAVANRSRAIFGAVIDQQQFQCAAVFLRQHTLNTAFQVFFCIIHRYYNRKVQFHDDLLSAPGPALISLFFQQLFK